MNNKERVIKVLLVCVIIVLIGAVIPCANYAYDDDNSAYFSVPYVFTFSEVNLALILHVTRFNFELALFQPSSASLYLELHEKSPPSRSLLYSNLCV